MSESKRTTPFSGLLRAISMDADALAADKGENNMLVKIKRNRERLDQCPTHDFEPQPDWRDGLPLLNRTIGDYALDNTDRTGILRLWKRALVT